MPLDPELFLGQARRLERGAENEADYRSAISRAYYACHLVAVTRSSALTREGAEGRGAGE